MAHAGGWDELIVVLALLAGLLLLGRRRKRGGAQQREEPLAPTSCPFCDETLELAAERCRSCGFRPGSGGSQPSRGQQADPPP